MRWIVLIAMFVSNSWATVTVNPDACPEHFEGKVKEVIVPVGTLSAFSTQKVLLKNERTLKGEVAEQVDLDTLVNGPFEFVPGQSYSIHMRGKKACWIEKI